MQPCPRPASAPSRAAPARRPRATADAPPCYLLLLSGASIANGSRAARTMRGCASEHRPRCLVGYEAYSSRVRELIEQSRVTSGVTSPGPGGDTPSPVAGPRDRGQIFGQQLGPPLTSRGTSLSLGCSARAESDASRVASCSSAPASARAAALELDELPASGRGSSGRPDLGSDWPRSPMLVPRRRGEPTTRSRSSGRRPRHPRIGKIPSGSSRTRAAFPPPRPATRIVREGAIAGRRCPLAHLDCGFESAHFGELLRSGRARRPLISAQPKIEPECLAPMAPRDQRRCGRPAELLP